MTTLTVFSAPDDVAAVDILVCRLYVGTGRSTFFQRHNLVRDTELFDRPLESQELIPGDLVLLRMSLWRELMDSTSSAYFRAERVVRLLSSPVDYFALPSA